MQCSAKHRKVPLDRRATDPCKARQIAEEGCYREFDRS